MKFAFALALLSLPAALAAQTPAMSDAPGRTGSGVTYTQPKDWTVGGQGAATVLSAPEGDLKIVLVKIGHAADARDAAARAWALYQPGMTRAVQAAAPAAPGDGWDERVGISYRTSPSEKLLVSATAMRAGGEWIVMILDGAEWTANKRSGAVLTLAQSLRPAGYVAESFAHRPAQRLTPARVQAMRDFVVASARALDVPGVGIALIDHGKVVWQGGVGVRALGAPDPVDAHTKFMVASNTKGMTTLLLSILADEGKLQWDEPVTQVYPAFRLGSDAVTKAVRMRDLVCACTGLPRRDFAFILADEGASVAETFRQLAVTQATSKFGELFQYNNLMASAAGYIAGGLLYPDSEPGAAFDKAMQTRVFGPLRMTDTTFDFSRGEAGDWAPPHGVDIDGKTVRMSNYFNHMITPHRPAGGVWSSAADMARYVQLELSKGVAPDGKRLVSEANLLERRKRGVPLGANFYYGMGLMQHDVSGVPIVTHGGTLQGYRSNFYILPDAGIGAVILTNADSGALLQAPFLRRLLELVYDGKPEAAQQVAVSAAQRKAQASGKRAGLTVPADPAVLAGLASHYRSEIGSITLSDRGGGKWIKAGFIEGPVATRNNADGSVSLVSIGPGAIGVDAMIGMHNGVRTLTVRDSQEEYVYTEQP